MLFKRLYYQLHVEIYTPNKFVSCPRQGQHEPLQGCIFCTDWVQLRVTNIAITLTLAAMGRKVGTMLSSVFEENVLHA